MNTIMHIAGATLATFGGLLLTALVLFAFGFLAIEYFLPWLVSLG